MSWHIHLRDCLVGFVVSELEDYFSRVTDQCVDAARSTIDDLTQSIKIN